MNHSSCSTGSQSGRDARAPIHDDTDNLGMHGRHWARTVDNMPASQLTPGIHKYSFISRVIRVYWLRPECCLGKKSNGRDVVRWLVLFASLGRGENEPWYETIR